MAAFVLGVLLVAPDAAICASDAKEASAVDGTLETKAFDPTDEDILNPERGFYVWVDLVKGRDYSDVRRKGFTVAYAKVHLDDYRTRPLDEKLLRALNEGFARARTDGIKLLPRFVYCDDGKDAPKNWILRHIDQLAPTLQANADVIAVMHAGFIGKWGEWHSSAHGLDNPRDRTEILRAVLKALPKSRMVLVRTPHFKHEALGDPLTAEEAYTGTDRARVGHLNDAFLATRNDMGTYLEPIDKWMDYVARDSRFVPVGGETCRVNPPRSDGEQALRELRRHHWTFLNDLYHRGVLKRWRQQKVFGQIRRRLGYRLSLTQASWTKAPQAGGGLALTVKLRNSGYASMFNARPVYVVLDGDKTRWAHRLGPEVDPRRWEGGRDAAFTATVPLPDVLGAGTYRLALWLPDDAPSLRARPEYAVRLANQGVWDAGTGMNVLTAKLRIAPPAGR